MKLFLRQLIKKRTKHKLLLSSIFDSLASSFAMMEVSSQFRQIFKVMDSNGDGKLSSSELGEVLICLGCDKSNATKEAEGMLKQMDYNGDGFIDVDEFMDAVHDDSGGKPKEDYLMDAFLIFDINKNGLISAMELRRVLINLGCDKCTLEDCRRMIKGVDKDGDGFVDFEEFRSMLSH